jgi:hypothetical protein
MNEATHGNVASRAGLPVPLAVSLDVIVHLGGGANRVMKADLAVGDWLHVRTWNSVYRIQVLEDGCCEVSGGWFDRKGLSPYRTSIAGCTWGGSILHTRVAVGCGMCIEFGNRLTTSPVRTVVVIPSIRLA